MAILAQEAVISKARVHASGLQEREGQNLTPSPAPF